MDSTAARELLHCYRETGTHHDIYWYHWPRDGVFRRPDFEPVVYAYRDDYNICLLILRRAWRYRTFDVIELEEPIEVLFETPFHHPRARTIAGRRAFDDTKQDFIISNVKSEPLTVGLPEETINGIFPYRQNIYEKVEQLRTLGCL